MRLSGAWAASPPRGGESGWARCRDRRRIRPRTWRSRMWIRASGSASERTVCGRAARLSSRGGSR